jgi:hypothetical protein
MAQATITTTPGVLRRVTDGPGSATATRWSHAASGDGLWTFERQLEEPGQPWYATYLPTGQVQVFPSLIRATDWAASPAALPLLRQAAQDTLRAAVSPDEKARARRALLVHDGILITAEPDTLCECSGYLVCQAGQWRHVDVCKECWTPEHGAVSCPDGGAGHTACKDPEPVQCDHSKCRTAHDLYQQPCDHARSACCGCCHGENR